MGRAGAKFDLSVLVGERFDAEGAAGIGGMITGAVDLFERASVERMAASFVRVLRALVDDPSLRVNAVDVLGEAERRRVLVEWNDTAAEVPGRWFRDVRCAGCSYARCGGGGRRW